MTTTAHTSRNAKTTSSYSVSSPPPSSPPSDRLRALLHQHIHRRSKAVADSGATQHMLPDRTSFITYVSTPHAFRKWLCNDNWAPIYFSPVLQNHFLLPYYTKIWWNTNRYYTVLYSTIHTYLTQSERTVAGTHLDMWAMHLLKVLYFINVGILLSLSSLLVIQNEQIFFAGVPEDLLLSQFQSSQKWAAHVCIVGVWEDLELQSKMKHLIRPLLSTRRIKEVKVSLFLQMGGEGGMFPPYRNPFWFSNSSTQYKEGVPFSGPNKTVDLVLHLGPLSEVNTFGNTKLSRGTKQRLILKNRTKDKHCLTPRLVSDLLLKNNITVRTIEVYPPLINPPVNAEYVAQVLFSDNVLSMTQRACFSKRCLEICQWFAHHWSLWQMMLESYSIINATKARRRSRCDRSWWWCHVENRCGLYGFVWWEK